MGGSIECLGLTLLPIQISRGRLFFQHLGNADQRLRIVLIYAQHFASHLQHLLRVAGRLVASHRGPIEQDAHFAVRKFCGKIVSRFLHDRWIFAVRDCRLVCLILGRCLGLNRCSARSSWGHILARWGLARILRCGESGQRDHS